MSTIIEVEEVIKKLPAEEAHQLWDWLLDYFEDKLEVTEGFQRQIAEGRREIASGEFRTWSSQCGSRSEESIPVPRNFAPETMPFWQLPPLGEIAIVR